MDFGVFGQIDLLHLTSLLIDGRKTNAVEFAAPTVLALGHHQQRPLHRRLVGTVLLRIDPATAPQLIVDFADARRPDTLPPEIHAGLDVAVEVVPPNPDLLLQLSDPAVHLVHRVAVQGLQLITPSAFGLLLLVEAVDFADRVLELLAEGAGHEYFI